MGIYPSRAQTEKNTLSEQGGQTMVVIRFKTHGDEVNGYYLLALKGTIRGLRDKLYEINDFMLKYLDAENIKYEIVEKDVLSETEKIRNTPAIAV